MKTEIRFYTLTAVVVFILLTGGSLAAELPDGPPAAFSTGSLITADGMNNRFTALYSAVNALEPRVGTLETDLTALGPRVSTLEPKVSSLEPKVSTLETDVTALEPRVGTLETRVNGNIDSTNLASDGASLSKVSGGRLVTNGKGLSISTAGFNLDDIGLTISHYSHNPIARFWGATDGSAYITVGKPAGGTGGGQIRLGIDGTEGFIFGKDGFIGINHGAPSVSLDVQGSIEYTGTCTTASDRRLKENLLPIGGAAEKVQGISGYTFNMIAEPGRRQAGVIAQDVQKVLPEAVSIIDDEGHLGVDYTQLVPLLVEAVKEQQKMIDDLKMRLAELEK